jgi:hypothetical protein
LERVSRDIGIERQRERERVRALEKTCTVLLLMEKEIHDIGCVMILYILYVNV